MYLIRSFSHVWILYFIYLQISLFASFPSVFCCCCCSCCWVVVAFFLSFFLSFVVVVVVDMREFMLLCMEPIRKGRGQSVFCSQVQVYHSFSSSDHFHSLLIKCLSLPQSVDKVSSLPQSVDQVSFSCAEVTSVRPLSSYTSDS